MKMDQYEYLPKDIMEKILLRLPVKSLTRFKCVCKAWRRLICDLYFVKTHLRRPQTLARSWVCKIDCRGVDYDDRENPVAVRAFTRECIAAMRGESVDDDDAAAAAAAAAASFDIGRFKGKAILLNSCNGLLCTVDSRCRGKMVIWNPSTRQRHQVPPMKNNNIPAVVVHSEVHSGRFAYVSSSDDYKVVVVSRMTYTTSTNDREFGIAVDVFSLKSNQWKIILEEEVDYWLDSGSAEDVTSVFDIEKEEFRPAMAVPPEGRRFYIYPILITVVGGCLCMMDCMNPGEVWVVGEYGNAAASWTKLIINTTSPPNHILLDHQGRPTGVVRLIDYSQDDQYYLFLHKSEMLALYDRNHNAYKNIMPYGPYPTWFQDDANLYMETLVSPHPPTLT